MNQKSPDRLEENVDEGHVSIIIKSQEVDFTVCACVCVGSEKRSECEAQHR